MPSQFVDCSLSSRRRPNASSREVGAPSHEICHHGKDAKSVKMDKEAKKAPVVQWILPPPPVRSSAKGVPPRKEPEKPKKGLIGMVNVQAEAPSKEYTDILAMLMAHHKK